MKKLNSGQSLCLDGIFNNELKHGRGDVTKCLDHLLQDSWRKGCIPDNWHGSLMVVLFKDIPGDEDICGNCFLFYLQLEKFQVG